MSDKSPHFRSGLPACFAPPLTAETLAEYRTLADSADAPVADAIRQLADMAELFLQTPKSTEESTPLLVRRQSGKVQSVPCTPLAAAEVERIWDAVPWDHECEAMSKLFAGIADKPLRKAAYHLLWYAKELTRDREPMTLEVLNP